MNKPKKHFYKIKVEKKFNFGCLAIFLIICFLVFYLFCLFFIWMFKYEELKLREKLNDYSLIEREIKEINNSQKYKIVMFRELDAVSWCESKHDDNASNPYSSALGCFQIINTTKELCEKHLGKSIDRTNKKDSWDCAIWLYNRYGLQHWNASKKCWETLIK